MPSCHDDQFREFYDFTELEKSELQKMVLMLHNKRLLDGYK